MDSSSGRKRSTPTDRTSQDDKIDPQLRDPEVLDPSAKQHKPEGKEMKKKKKGPVTMADSPRYRPEEIFKRYAAEFNAKPQSFNFSDSGVGGFGQEQSSNGTSSAAPFAFSSVPNPKNVASQPPRSSTTSDRIEWNPSFPQDNPSPFSPNQNPITATPLPPLAFGKSESLGRADSNGAAIPSPSITNFRQTPALLSSERGIQSQSPPTVEILGTSSQQNQQTPVLDTDCGDQIMAPQANTSPGAENSSVNRGETRQPSNNVPAISDLPLDEGVPTQLSDRDLDPEFIAMMDSSVQLESLKADMGKLEIKLAKLKAKKSKKSKRLVRLKRNFKWHTERQQYEESLKQQKMLEEAIKTQKTQFDEQLAQKINEYDNLRSAQEHANVIQRNSDASIDLYQRQIEKSNRLAKNALVNENEELRRQLLTQTKKAEYAETRLTEVQREFENLQSSMEETIRQKPPPTPPQSPPQTESTSHHCCWSQYELDEAKMGAENEVIGKLRFDLNMANIKLRASKKYQNQLQGDILSQDERIQELKKQIGDDSHDKFAKYELTQRNLNAQIAELYRERAKKDEKLLDSQKKGEEMQVEKDAKNHDVTACSDRLFKPNAPRWLTQKKGREARWASSNKLNRTPPPAPDSSNSSSTVPSAADNVPGKVSEKPVTQRDPPRKFPSDDDWERALSDMYDMPGVFYEDENEGPEEPFWFAIFQLLGFYLLLFGLFWALGWVRNASVDDGFSSAAPDAASSRVSISNIKKTSCVIGNLVVGGIGLVFAPRWDHYKGQSKYQKEV